MNKPFKMMMEETWAGASWDISQKLGTNLQEISNDMSLLWPSDRQFRKAN